jgi:nitrite reductase/ring-hydroxylating ferredoxin subunit
MVEHSDESPRQRPLCRSEELQDNAMKLFNLDSHLQVLVGRTQGRLFACNNSCPHRGASLAKGDLKNERIICYMHGYEYNVFTGRLVNMKSWKKEETWMEQSPAWRKSDDLLLYQVYEKDGIVYVRV